MIKIEFLTKETLLESLPKVINLYKCCFNNDLDEKTFIWRYIENPIKDLLFVVAKDGEKIIASYSASPCLMVSDGITYHTAMSLNTMTHPNYRGQGLFIRLANALYKYMSEHNYKMIWGFPNNISNRMFNQKLGWKTLYEVPTMISNIKDKTVEDINMSIVSDPKFKLDYSKICSSSIKSMYVKKNERYFKWRYANNPDNKYMQSAVINNGIVEAYIVYKEYNDLVNIVDINFTKIEDANELIKHTINFAVSNNKNAITIWAPINTELHMLLEKNEFYNDYPVRYLGARLLIEEENSENEMLSYYNWFINAGDNNEY